MAVAVGVVADECHADLLRARIDGVLRGSMSATRRGNPTVLKACSTIGLAALPAYAFPHATSRNRQPISISGPMPSYGISRTQPRNSSGRVLVKIDQ